ncbi:bifunctional 4-hydroxy-2-oxoglutarate aldolase/2-dehydro-3-deoxy-phosphogluconate aldolase [Schaalia sp. lx-100]|uniref:bifunctional 4-hydroxy-2-oxoglutarate aldolase/2-dehydro-3-deoxy-phosphogluconate aldolase n=1 Tax=Schaalia sp. lx-100 TaxID=2899081 RepID=UPI001E53E20F|nr:bifunctional 4-hydroxy-2-oxoglutarate aldolase/2-dehydro-3-deoxy-phosphogluconate aldolase [Schaalia sp. lx-100]
MSLHDLFTSNPVIPVVVVDSVDQGINVAHALLAGGITTAEVTFRTAAAPDAIREMSRIDGLNVGAGTVLNVAQAEAAIKAGATYIVSPGFSANVVRYCQEAGVPVLPACTDGTLIMAALEYGLDTVKFFPANIMGGIPAMSSFASVFPQLRFVPTGGVNAQNLAEYLAVPHIAACGGSWMVDKKLIHANQWDTITSLCAQAMTIAKETGR